MSINLYQYSMFISVRHYYENIKNFVFDTDSDINNTTFI